MSKVDWTKPLAMLGYADDKVELIRKFNNVGMHFPYLCMRTNCGGEETYVWVNENGAYESPTGNGDGFIFNIPEKQEVYSSLYAWGFGANYDTLQDCRDSRIASECVGIAKLIIENEKPVMVEIVETY